MASLPEYVVDFANAECEVIKEEFNDPGVVDAPYESRTWAHFSASEIGAVAGIWEAPLHRHRCEFSHTEMCHILQGTVRLTDHNGVAKTFGPGDSFVVQQGFKGYWENLSDVRKIYFIIG